MPDIYVVDAPLSTLVFMAVIVASIIWVAYEAGRDHRG